MCVFDIFPEYGNILWWIQNTNYKIHQNGYVRRVQGKQWLYYYSCIFSYCLKLNCSLFPENYGSWLASLEFIPSRKGKNPKLKFPSKLLHIQSSSHLEFSFFSVQNRHFYVCSYTYTYSYTVTIHGSINAFRYVYNGHATISNQISRNTLSDLSTCIHWS